MSSADLANPRLSRWSVLLGACLVVTLTGRALADPRAVVELFTSQGCSSCPAADKLMGELGKDPSIITLSLPIDYWDYLGWKDTLADPRFSARQRAYSHMRGDRDVYTPQVVVNGSAHVLGSDRAGIEHAAAHADGDAMSIPISLKQTDKLLSVSVAAGHGHVDHGEVWICAISKSIPITIGRGENRGREVVYHNVVRNWLKVGDWTGKAGSWDVPLENIKSEGVDAAVVYVQNGNRENPGAMLGAAYAPLD